MRQLAIFFVILIFAWTTSASAAKIERVTGWVSEENCKEQHAKPGGKDCVKKCLRGGAHVGHPEWLPQKMVLVEEGTKKNWSVVNPESLTGYEGERVMLSAEISDSKLRVVEVHPYHEPVPSKLFEFHNGFWLNLHHFVRGEARRALHPEAKPDVALVVKLTDEETKTWNEALEYYKKHFAEKDLVFDNELLNVKKNLSRVKDFQDPLPAELDPVHKQVLAGASPVYRKHWWPEHQRSNQEWIRVAQRLLDQFGNRIVEQIKPAYGIEWPAQAIHTDVTIEAGWSGAYTSVDPLHITIASKESRIQDYAALEILFHEASHAWGDWLIKKLEAVQLETNQKVSERFWHTLIFYTAGEITRSVLEQAGMRNYIPYAQVNQIYERHPQDHCALDRRWKEHLHKKGSDPEAAFKALVREIANCKS